LDITGHKLMVALDEKKAKDLLKAVPLDFLILRWKDRKKMSTFGVHRLDWLVVSKRFPWNAKYETVYGWLASFIVIYTIMNLKS
jgi:hypothetical protein